MTKTVLKEHKENSAGEGKPPQPWSSGLDKCQFSEQGQLNTHVYKNEVGYLFKIDQRPSKSVKTIKLLGKREKTRLEEILVTTTMTS